MKDLGPLKYFLGLDVAWNGQRMYLCPCKYNLDIPSDAGLLGSKPLSFPMEQNHQLGKIRDLFFCLLLILIGDLWEGSSIVLSPDLTWHTLSMFWLNLSINPDRITGMQPLEYFATWKGLLVKVFSFSIILIFNSVHIVIRIGQAVLLLDALWLDISYPLVTLLSHGKLRSSIPYHVLPQKQSIGLWLSHVVN